MSLDRYHKRRDFSKIKEPVGKILKSKQSRFFIQKHAASHLHYDFRLEIEGVLKSQAVPKGPSLDPKAKRLAILVEDHPLDYGNFEGIIPKRQYGGGTVLVWDKGSWTSLDEKPLEALQKGHLRFELKGKKLLGRWDLIRLKKEKNSWFLVKYDDRFANKTKDITEDAPLSVLSDRTIDQIKENTILEASPKKKSKH